MTINARPKPKSLRHGRVPEVRIQSCNSAPVRGDGDFVLYWMIAFRRLEWNFSLQRAVDWARELRKPLVVFEPLRAGYRWASDRLHRFVVDGMADHSAWIATAKFRGVIYYPYVEPAADADKGLLAALATRASIIVTDDYPSFFLPRMVTAAARLPVRLEQVDSNGLLPLRGTDRVFSSAYSFRRFLQQELHSHLSSFPLRNPLAGAELPAINSLPVEIVRQWPPASPRLLKGVPAELAKLPIDHSVLPVNDRGGPTEARKRLLRFLNNRLAKYAVGANDPDCDLRSGLSPYLHFGHIAAHAAFHELASRERWSIGRTAARVHGRREGWWGMSGSAEQWLDELITWRELGFNMSSHRADSDRYESLPEWSRTTLEKHEFDRREHVYSLEDFAAARTHDLLWNAAQTQLLREGRIHNYLRMLWGKKIVEWTASPRDSLEVMIELNNRYAVVGRDPNSYSGIFWCLGRYDRPWGPERPIFGTVRYMSSQNTMRKLKLDRYMQTFGAGPS